MCPGECLVYDRGEFCNNVMEILNNHFGAKIRIISAGRPQGNGQAEAFVGSLKNKIHALMVQEGFHLLPECWDETLLSGCFNANYQYLYSLQISYNIIYCKVK